MGFYAFTGGIFGVLTGGSAISWLANPFLILGLILTFRGSRYSIICSSLALLFCLSFLLFDQVMENEAGQYGKIISIEIGYWMWTLSSVMLVITNILFKRIIEVTDDRF